MADHSLLRDPARFSAALYEKLGSISPAVRELELYEFRYCLDNLSPSAGWDSVYVPGCAEIESLIRQKDFFASIQLKPERDGQPVMDEQIVWLSQTLLTGLVSGQYPAEWIRRLFYFDPRGFFFLPRTDYFPAEIRAHFGGGPTVQFQPTQSRFDTALEIGYREFKEANRAIDQAFLDVTRAIIAAKGAPLLLCMVGPSAAGKTEISERLRAALTQSGRSVGAIEMDHFFKDRDYRDGREVGLDSIHYDLFKACLADLLAGRKALSPRYDFLRGTSSHDQDGRLRDGCRMFEIAPADILVLEGNFPFHIPEIAPLVGLKIVYLTDDPIRLKRKWKRDVDFRKKYHPVYLCNRFFRIQFSRAADVYLPMLAICDMAVDTTSAALWLTPEIRSGLDVDTFLSGSPSRS
jgi:uridine kinase